jgi:tyrosine-protein kinase Etk/Wzc
MEIQNSMQAANGLVNQKDDFDVKKFISKLFDYWYLILISLVFCITLGFLYTRYASPLYKINSKITIDDQTDNPITKASSSSDSMFDLSDLLELPSNAYNEMDILKSRDLMTQVVKALNLNIIIYKQGVIKKEELYDQAPFTVKLFPKLIQ